MSIDDLCYMSAHEAIKRFRNLSLSPVELLDAIIERANLISQTVNPFGDCYFEEAKERAKAWTKRQAEIDVFQRTFRYKFFEKVRTVLCRVLDWVQKQTVTPSPSSIKTDRQRAAKKTRTKPSFWKDF